MYWPTSSTSDGGHHLGDDGEAGFGPRLGQQLQSPFAQSPELVGGGAGFVGAAAQDGRPGGVDAAGGGEELFFASPPSRDRR